jgi:hypothetical protein
MLIVYIMTFQARKGWYFYRKVGVSPPMLTEVLHQPVEVCIHPTVAILLAIWKSLTTSPT